MRIREISKRKDREGTDILRVSNEDAQIVKNTIVDKTGSKALGSVAKGATEFYSAIIINPVVNLIDTALAPVYISKWIFNKFKKK